MVFNNPLFLYLLPLSLLPLLLHILFLKFIKKIPFPWLGFVEEKEDERKKRRRLRELLLLLSRILFLLFLLLFLSSPVLKRNVLPDFIIFDSSESTLLWRDEFKRVYGEISGAFGKEKIREETYLKTESEKGKIFVITDGDEDFFKKIIKNEASFFIFIPENKNDVGIWEAEVRGDFLYIKIFSSKKIDEGSLKLIADENPFSYTFGLEKGINEFKFPLKIKNFKFLKIQIFPLDSLPEDNIYFISNPQPARYYKIFGKSSRYIELIFKKMGYKLKEEINDSVISIFYGIPEEEESIKIMEQIINANKPCFVFLNKNAVFFESEEKRDIILKRGKDIIYFSKVFNIKKGKPILYEEGITIASIYKNTVIFGFLPEPSYTDLVYSPFFVDLLKIGIQHLKIPLPFTVRGVKDTLIYYGEGEYRIYDIEGNFLKKDYAENGGIDLKDLNYGSYVVKNSRILYIDLNFPKEEIIIKRIDAEQIKNILPNARLYKLKELKNFLPVSLKKPFLFISLLFLLLEIFLIILL